MSYIPIPTRTDNVDPNSASDINQIQENIKTVYDRTGIIETTIATHDTVEKAVSYAVLDTDGYKRIEVDTTSGDITITLPLIANNAKRRIEIAYVKGTTNKVIIATFAGNSGTLSNDALTTLWMPKVGDYVVLQHSSTSGFWEIVSERITSELKLDSHAGYGSTQTKIPKFTTSTIDIGNMFSHNHASGYNGGADGLKITFARSGRYAITYVGGSSTTVQNYAGITKNSTEVTVALESLTVPVSRLVLTKIPLLATTGAYGSVTVTRYFAKGDFIMPHASGTAPTTVAMCLFSCVYLGN